MNMQAASIKTPVSANRRVMYDLIFRHKQGLETAVRTITGLWNLRVVFEGTKAYREGNTIVLPNVDVFAATNSITDEDVENARAYFIALRGYAWLLAAQFVESDQEQLGRFRRDHGSFALALCSTLDDIRGEHRFGTRGTGIAEAMEYTRESWVWPRFARRKERGGRINILSEVFVGLQVTLKHYENRFDHVAWKAMSNEARTFVERNVDALDSAYDTLKMEKTPGTERLMEVSQRMLAQWKEEYDLVVPFAKQKAVKVDSDTKVTPKKDEALDVDEQMSQLLERLMPPLLLVTYSNKVSTLESARFAGGYIQRVEHLPVEPDGWDKLQPLKPGETRTLVIHPPDPNVERMLDELMGRMVRQMMQLNEEMQQKAEEQVEQARTEIEHLPADQQPYLVYTTENDVFITTPEGELHELAHLRDQTMKYHGVVKRRLQTLLRTRTKTRWKDEQEEGELLDNRALVRIIQSDMMPNMEVRPFRNRMQQDALLDTVVGLVTDVSGSMCGGGFYRHDYNSKLALARQATLCFAESLHMAKIRFGVWAFTSDEEHWERVYERASEADQKMYGRFGALHIETVKSFSENWMTVASRLPRMGSHNDANYDADSVQWAAQQLMAQKAKRRVLFVFSDGLPSTSEPPMQVARQQRQLGLVVKAMAAQGVEVVGIGICDASVQRYYPHNVVVHSAQDLPKVVMNEMKFLLLSGNRR